MGAYMRMPFSWENDPTLREDISGDAFRAYCMATLWSGKAHTDGWIETRQAHGNTPSSDQPAEELWRQLVDAELVRVETRQVRNREVEGYLLVDFSTEQRSSRDWQREKENNRDRQARFRARRRESTERENSQANQPLPHLTVAHADSAAIASGGSGREASWQLPDN